MGFYLDSFLSDHSLLFFSQYSKFTDCATKCDCFSDVLVSFNTLYAHFADLGSSYHLAFNQLCHCIQGTVSNLLRFTEEELRNNYGKFIFWISSEREYFALLRMAISGRQHDKLCSLLRICSVFEFSLARLCWNKQSGYINNMNALLSSHRLAEILGVDTTMVLKLFFGPVSTLNLRNLAWHGFITPSDLDCIHIDIVIFIFVIILSIGHLLILKHAIIPQRPSLESMLDLCKPIYAQINNSFPYDGSLIDYAIGHPILYCSSVAFLNYIDEFFNIGSPRYLDSVCISLVLISLIIRVEFARSIDWAEGVMSSETRFFLTLDSILRCEFKKIIPNSCILTLKGLKAFCDGVGDRILVLLSDILSYETGPRLKDRLSHGELWWTECTGDESRWKAIAITLRSCIIILLLKYSTCAGRMDFSFLQMYRPSFHPLSDLVSKVNNLIWHTRDLSKLLLPHGLCDQKIEERVFISTTMFCEFFGALPRDEEVNGTLAIRTDQLWRWFKTPPFPELAEGWDCTNRYSCLGHLSTHWAGRPEMLARRFLAIISQFLRVGQLIISALKKHPITASSTDKSDSFRCFVATWLTLSSSVTIFVKLALVHWLWAPIFFEETLESKSGKIFVTPTMDSDFGSKSTLGQSSICFVRYDGKAKVINDKAVCLSILRKRAHFIEKLERSGDKLVMWTRKRKWNLALDFLTNLFHII